MAESRPVQCTEKTDGSIDDLVTSVAGHPNHHALLSKTEELEKKIHQLEQLVADNDEEICDCDMLLGNRGGGGSTSVESGRCVNSSCGTRVDLIQNLLLKNANLQNENKELRDMYENVTKDLDLLKRLPRQCLLVDEKNRLLEQELLWTKTLFAQKEREWEIAQKKLKELQHVQTLMKTKGTRFTHSTTGSTDCAVIQDLQATSSIRLGEQMSPPLKRGRFTMQKTLHECSRCSSFFETKEDAEKVPCSYHSKDFVPALLRHGSSNNIDPVKCSDVFWPCCQKLGINATKCTLNGMHRLN